MATRLIDGERLWRSLDEFAAIGGTGAGGVDRLALSDADRTARDRLAAIAQEEGFALTVDAVGNMFLRRAGREPDRPPVQIGSHLDTVQGGGRYDGAYGVLAGLEVLRALNAGGIETSAPVELVNWTGEEGARFPLPMLGSRVFAGTLPLADALALSDREGTSVATELARIDYAGRAAPGHAVAAYLEAHIEQGPVLEDADLPVGIVTGIQARRRVRVTIGGEAAHAGTCPIDRRHDALVAASAATLQIRAIAVDTGPDARATVGGLTVRPGAANVVPDYAELLVDVRHPDDATVDAMVGRIEAAVHAAAAQEGCSAQVTVLSAAQSTVFDERCVAALRSAAVQSGLDHMDLVSGGGHDAGPMATIVPAAMVFIPCERGISHNPAEAITPEAAAAGCEVLCRAAIGLAG